MSTSTFTVQVRPDNIVLVKSEDTSPETLADWEKRISAELDSYTEPHKHLYDMRHLPSIFINAVRTGINLRKHKNADLAYTTVLVSNSTVSALVKASLSINAGGHFRLFMDEDAAITWLNQQIPN